MFYITFNIVVNVSMSLYVLEYSIHDKLHKIILNFKILH
jgi:hypothetical protein